MDQIQLVILFITLFIVFFIPTILLILQYQNTRIVDYIILAFFFGLVLLSTVFEPLMQIYGNLVFFQLRMGIFNISYLVLMWYAQRIRKSKDFGFTWYVSVVWFMILEIIILFWEPIIQPESQNLWRLTMLPSTSSFTFPKGAGLVINDFVVLSSDYRFLSELFWIYVTVFLVKTYYSLELIQPTRRTIIARRGWIIAFILYLLYYIPVTLSFNHINLPESIVTLSIIIIGIISFTIPESILLSHVQILRVSNLHKLVTDLTQSKEIKRINYYENSLIDYLEMISKTLKGDK